MFPAYDAFSVLSKGYACGLGTTGYQAFALFSKGYLCEADEARRGGDPKGAWGDTYAYFRRRQRELNTISEDTPTDLAEEIDFTIAAIADLEQQLANIKVQDTTLLQLDLTALQDAIREQKAFESMQIEEIRRDNVIYLAAFRAQKKADELARLIEIGRQIRRQLQDELAVAISLIAILFK